MNMSDTLSVLARRMAIIVGVVIVATLHLAQDVLIPRGPGGAVLLSARAAREFPRTLLRPRAHSRAVLLTTAIAFSLVGALASMWSPGNFLGPRLQAARV